MPRRIPLSLTLILFTCVAASAVADDKTIDRYTWKRDHDPNGIGKFYMGREIAHVMGFAGAAWLERDTREEEERLTLLVRSLELKPGMVVADIGAGSGVISMMMAERALPNGEILAVDVQPEMLNRLMVNTAEKGIRNIRPIWGRIKHPHLESNSVDLAIMVDVYHEFEYPWEMLKAISDSLKPGGRVAFVEYRMEDPTVPIKLVHKMSEAQVRLEAEQPGLNLKYVTTIDVLPRQHIVVFAKTEITDDDESLPERAPIVLTDEARKLHQSSLVFDGHNDLPWTLRKNANSSFDEADIATPQPEFHTDIPRLREGGLGAQFWSVYAPAETRQAGTAAQYVMEQIDIVRRMIRRYPDTFELALTADDVERIHADGKIASLIGMEGGHAIEDSLSMLRALHRLGARYMTLTHSDTLDWADSATDDPRSDGLSPFGEEVVQEMNRLGMLVDISHVSVDTMKDAIAVSQAPTIFSHSSARAVADHVRNVPDDVLRLIRDKDGVVMVNYFSGFVVPESAAEMTEMFNVRRGLTEKYPDDPDAVDREYEAWRREHPMQPGTIHDVLDHIDHISQVAGPQHVGLGSDYDGISMLPRQLEDVSTYPLITQGLMDRGYTDEQIRGILGGNVLRVMRKAEAVSRQIQAGEN